MKISPITSSRLDALGVVPGRKSHSTIPYTSTQEKLALIANRQFRYGLGAAFVGKPVAVAEGDRQRQVQLQSLRNEQTELRGRFTFELPGNRDLLPMGATAAGNQPDRPPSPFIPEPDYDAEPAQKCPPPDYDLATEPKCPEPDYDHVSEPECPPPDYKRVSFDKVVTVITFDPATVCDSESDMGE